MKTGKGLVAEVKKMAIFFTGPALNKCRTVTSFGGALSHLGRNMEFVFHVIEDT